jgi:hypothetical protein
VQLGKASGPGAADAIRSVEQTRVDPAARRREATVFKPDGSGYRPVARVQADEWTKLAQ